MRHLEWSVDIFGDFDFCVSLHLCTLKWLVFLFHSLCSVGCTRKCRDSDVYWHFGLLVSFCQNLHFVVLPRIIPFVVVPRTHWRLFIAHDGFYSLCVSVLYRFGPHLSLSVFLSSMAFAAVHVLNIWNSNYSNSYAMLQVLSVNFRLDLNSHEVSFILCSRFVHILNT